MFPPFGGGLRGRTLWHKDLDIAILLFQPLRQNKKSQFREAQSQTQS